jgi:hypothetical protein
MPQALLTAWGLHKGRTRNLRVVGKSGIELSVPLLPDPHTLRAAALILLVSDH